MNELFSVGVVHTLLSGVVIRCYRYVCMYAEVEKNHRLCNDYILLFILSFLAAIRLRLVLLTILVIAISRTTAVSPIY